MNTRIPLVVAALTLSLTSLSASTVVYDFSGTQYADNFTESVNAANMSVTGGVLNMTTSTGSLSGITSLNTPITTVNTEDFSVKADVRFNIMPSSLGGTSFGFITNINGGAGYLSVIRLNTSGGVSNADFRVFEGTLLNGTSVGTQVGTTSSLNQAALGSTVFNQSTFYTLLLDVDATAGTSIRFTASILNSANSSVIGTFTSILDNSPTFGGTSMALRLGVGGNNVATSVDNLSITNASAVPEPSAFALLGGLSALGLVATKRRRR